MKKYVRFRVKDNRINAAQLNKDGKIEFLGYWNFWWDTKRKINFLFNSLI